MYYIWTDDEKFAYLKIGDGGLLLDDRTRFYLFEGQNLLL